MPRSDVAVRVSKYPRVAVPSISMSMMLTYVSAAYKQVPAPCRARGPLCLLPGTNFTTPCASHCATTRWTRSRWRNPRANRWTRS
ncbi:Uncharacterised protein [Mycobacteroides abscessus subsp. abscessus]|nr:Uncharacterised protein [Mycobacteroides abscessus subsp. abscessus]